MKLERKVVLITDATSNAGKAVATKFATEGAILVLNNCFSSLQPTDTPFTMHTVADLTKKTQVDALVTEIIARYGKIDVLIHNNNDIIPITMMDCTDEMYDRALNVNAKSAFLCTQTVGSWMMKARYGKIVYISSIHDEKPTGSVFAYSVAKGAVKMLAREMALDLGPYNITTNIINVGPVEGDGEQFASQLSFKYENMNSKIPNQKLITMEDIANAALFLSTDESRMMNGADLLLDGGFTLSYLPRYNYEDYMEAVKNELNK